MTPKHKGLRGIFTKIKGGNNNNVSLVEDVDGDFKRGGFRATAGPRLGWNSQEKPTKPFVEWDIEALTLWFDEMGLGMYQEDLQRWLKNDFPAKELLEAAPIDIEKELNLKSPIHRKKIVLALADISGQEQDEQLKMAGKLDTSWILRWLDDIGLPQHKDEFMAARVDGRVLHKLTMEDLVTLHVSAALHVASLKRGIQVNTDLIQI